LPFCPRIASDYDAPTGCKSGFSKHHDDVLGLFIDPNTMIEVVRKNREFRRLPKAGDVSRSASS